MTIRDGSRLELRLVRFASPRVDALDTVNKWIEVHYQPGQVFPSRFGEILNNGQLSVDSDRGGIELGKRNNIVGIIARGAYICVYIDSADKFDRKMRKM